MFYMNPQLGITIGALTFSADSIRCESTSPTELRCQYPMEWGDFKGNGIEEVAYRADDGRLIFDNLSGQQQEVTDNKFDNKFIRLWMLKGQKAPFLALAEAPDQKDESDNRSVCLLQWNGKFYDEVWRSDELDEEIIDAQIGDPKGEGVPGLVILSDDGKEYHLTKIIPY